MSRLDKVLIVSMFEMPRGLLHDIFILYNVFVKLYNEDGERVAMYKLFSDLFMKEPSEETLIGMKDMFGMKFEDSPEEIRNDFAGLFLRNDLHLSPHESLYNYPPGDIPRLRGRTTEEVRSLYRAAGLMIDEETGIIPDHISIELLFMGYLVDNNLIEQQQVFMEDHLLQWIPDYCGKLEKHTETLFYKEVANILKEFISSEHELLRA